MADVKEILNRMGGSGIVIVTGRRGSGKDVTATRIALDRQKETGRQVLSNYDPYRFRLPRGWKLRRGASTPKDSIVLQSDAQLELFAREWHLEEHAAVIKWLTIARHRDSDAIMTTQLARILDVNVIDMADAIVFKEPSALAPYLERGEIRSLTARAARVFGLTENEDGEFEDTGKFSKKEKWEMAWVFTHTGSFLVTGIRKPPFWTEEMSKSYGGVDIAGRGRITDFVKRII